jgi:hypothetical protein
MRAASPALVLLLLGAAGPLAAQNSQCQPYAGQARSFNTCNAVVDGTQAFHPLLGLLTSGGTPVLGTMSGLGGFGHFYASARVNATHVVLPDLNYDGSTTTVGAGDRLFFPSPVVEVAMGVFSGLRGGLLSLDLLGSAQLLPTTQIANFSVAPGARRIGSVALGLGFGGRLGILRETALTPGVAVSVMHRNIPEVRYGDLANGGNLSFATDLDATNIRVTAGKRFSVLNLGGGMGWDHYTGDGTAQFRNPTTLIPEAAVAVALSHSRTMGFADVGLDLGHFKLTTELGYQLGRDPHLVTTFTDFDPASGRFFAAAGITLGL